MAPGPEAPLAGVVRRRLSKLHSSDSTVAGARPFLLPDFSLHERADHVHTVCLGWAVSRKNGTSLLDATGQPEAVRTAREAELLTQCFCTNDFRPIRDATFLTPTHIGPTD